MPRRGENIRKRKDGRWEARFIKGHSPEGRALYSSVYGSSYYEVKDKRLQKIKLIQKNETINKPLKTKFCRQVFTMREQKILEQFSLKDVNGTKLAILLSLYTGLRLGEICGLCWSHIDFTKNVIMVQKTVQRIADYDNPNRMAKTVLVINEPKTASSCRIIPIPSRLMAIISMYKKKVDTQFVISDHKDNCMDPRTLQYRFRRCLEQCSLRYINFHALRHTFATRCIELGVDIKSLSELLGHANVNTTLNIYVHSSLEQKRNQMKLLNTIIGQ